MNIRNFHTSFKNMCFRERRGESLQVYKPVSLSLRYISFILRGLRARLFGRGSQLHFLSGSTDGSFYFRLGVRASVLGVGLTISVVFVSLFACFWTPENPFLFFSFFIHFFLCSNHYFDNICIKNELPMYASYAWSTKISARVNYIP